MQDNNSKDDNNMQENKSQAQRKPNESGIVQVQGHIKIFDPNTGEVFVDKRS